MSKIAVVGLGYVGLPVAMAFDQKNDVIGFDISKDRIEELKMGYDRTNEVSTEHLKTSSIVFTDEVTHLHSVDYMIVAVPTPIDAHMNPDLRPIISATELIGAQLRKNTTVVYESTVYPGLTEEICIPILEKKSGLIAGKDFGVGYSPERINPGDKEHTFTKIQKVVAGLTPEITEELALLYGEVVEAGIHKASSIKVAEAAKIIENTQRDVNIALMNELAIIFKMLNIDTNEVLEAALTKWNFLDFKPGLVGGHCIGVDPYYLTYKANEVGFIPEIILAGRRLNDSFDQHIASEVVKQFIKQNKTIPGAKITILGVTFKENVPDIRNSKIFNLISELESYGMIVQLQDFYACPKEVKEIHGYDLTSWEDLEKTEAVLLAVPHDQYLTNSTNSINTLFTKDKNKLFFDIKGFIPKNQFGEEVSIWRL